MRTPARTLVFLAALGLAGLVGCSADSGAEVGSDVGNHTEILTLDNVFLEHAHPAYWEPGFPEGRFPAAAEIFYGYRPLEGVEIELPGACADHVAVQTEGEGYQAAVTLWCTPDGDEAQAFPFTTASKNFGQEELAFDVVVGTSFEFIDTVSLERLEPGLYALHVQPPEAAQGPDEP